mmetsp:Transcript_14360/g.25714  ORF Transcript_14360/g.25714 Transcript_14360/m.25714 type:complete len:569 (-) Transcript_14360:226-1932(-)|eukprot:CAMPEP_0196143492 /NCGR_PEP_ID=MMETSP0910-20130528/13492_1 /TAXON_ID=49265 /ORGANISM="Thalassiosira rotula, Strain GSO102" /LENGTH=568 /DNA_ID=CAMNT_0041404963 /DNA_START=292 /DNA_END=1998 /DNA_ORIENTATION=+
MGNDQSTVIDEERKMLESLYQISEGRLDNNDRNHVNSKVNAGTSAPNCQPSHTLKEIEEERVRREKEEEQRQVEREIKEAERLAGLLDINDSQHRAYLEEQHRKRLDSQSSSGSTKSSQSLSASQQAQLQQGSLGSYVQMAKTGYQELVNAIIRPPRAKYREEHLGPPAFSFLGKRFTRTDFTLQTTTGLNLQCSHWEPVERTAVRIPVVIYMHGNASARIEVLPQLTVLLALGVAVFAFDFGGSGKSDGEHVTLGYFEREDLLCVVAHLRATDVVSTIALWGRSMGAVTALMHGDRDPSIAGMVLDSPFADLTRLCEEMVDKARDQGINVPGFVSSVAIRMIRGSVRRQAEFDIKDVSPITHVPHCYIPALFVAAENDDFITKAHSLSLHDAYAGDANMIVVDGDHNSTRPRFMFDSVSIFLQACLQIPPEWQLRIHPSMNVTSPPWRYPGAQNSRHSSPTHAMRRPEMHSVTSPTRRSNLDDDSEIDLEEEAAAAIAAGLDFTDDDDNNSGANIDVETLGMTSERQREIEGSLFRMLGHETENEGESGENKEEGANGETAKAPSGV